MDSLKPLVGVKESLMVIEGYIKKGDVDPYNVVEMMSHELRDHLGAALYAYSANADALTDREYVLDELTGIGQEDGEYE